MPLSPGEGGLARWIGEWGGAERPALRREHANHGSDFFAPFRFFRGQIGGVFFVFCAGSNAGFDLRGAGARGVMVA